MMVPLKLLRSCVFCLVLCVGSTGCVRVPEQAVVLSNVVGERIGDMQASHEKICCRVFSVDSRTSRGLHHPTLGADLPR